MMKKRIKIFLLLLCPGVVAAAEIPSADQIMARVEEADRARRQLMTGYTATREYAVENDRFHVKASMNVEVTVDREGEKHFRILSVSGPGPVRNLVFQRMLDTEAKASAPQQQAATRICRENYSFRFVETNAIAGRPAYVLEAEPQSSNPLLFRGRIWVDAQESAIAKIEGQPAQKPSFWVTSTSFVHNYIPVNQQWVAEQNRSDSEIRVFGHSRVLIKYGDYAFAEKAPSISGAP